MNARDELSALCLSFLKQPVSGGNSWTLNPVALADAIIASEWLAAHDAGVRGDAIDYAWDQVVTVWSVTDDPESAIDPYLDAIRPPKQEPTS